MEKDAFCDVHFALGKKPILQNIRLEQRACLVDPLGFSSDFGTFKLSCFVDTQNRAHTQEKANSTIGPIMSIRAFEFESMDWDIWMPSTKDRNLTLWVTRLPGHETPLQARKI